MIPSESLNDCQLFQANDTKAPPKQKSHFAFFLDGANLIGDLFFKNQRIR